MKRPAVTLLRWLLMLPPGGAMALHAGTRSVSSVCSRACQGFFFPAFGVGFKTQAKSQQPLSCRVFQGRRKCLGEVLDEELRCPWRLRVRHTSAVSFHSSTLKLWCCSWCYDLFQCTVFFKCVKSMFFLVFLVFWL